MKEQTKSDLQNHNLTKSQKVKEMNIENVTRGDEADKQPEVYVSAQILYPGKPAESVGVWISPELNVRNARRRVRAGKLRISVIVGSDSGTIVGRHSG